MMLTKKNVNKEVLKYLAPALIAMLFVHVIPILWGVYISFLDLDINNLSSFFNAPFTGFKNYFELFSKKGVVSGPFFNSIKNIFIFGIITIPADLTIAFLVALLLNSNIKLKTIIRGIVLLPYITPDAVMYNVWRFIFQARIGIVNMILINIGLIDRPLIWLVGDRAMVSVIIATVWKCWPYAALVLLAGLQGIPKELLEAARADGANAWQCFWKIIFPMMWPITRTLLLISFIWNFHSFNQFYVMLGGDTSSKAAVPSLVILEEGFSNMHFGLGSAMAVVLLLIIFVLTFTAIINKKEEV